MKVSIHRYHRELQFRENLESFQECSSKLASRDEFNIRGTKLKDSLSPWLLQRFNVILLSRGHEEEQLQVVSSQLQEKKDPGLTCILRLVTCN